VASFPCPSPGCKGHCFQAKNAVLFWRGRPVVVPTELANAMIGWTRRGESAFLRPFTGGFTDEAIDEARRVDVELGEHLQRAQGQQGFASAVGSGVIVTCNCGHGPFIVDLPSPEP
jgi:hypothetical protein